MPGLSFSTCRPLLTPIFCPEILLPPFNVFIFLPRAILNFLFFITLVLGPDYNLYFCFYLLALNNRNDLREARLPVLWTSVDLFCPSQMGSRALAVAARMHFHLSVEGMSTGPREKLTTSE